MSRPRRVVLTGLGVVSPIGLDLASFKAALAAGKSGIRRIRSYDPSGLPVQIAGEIRPSDYPRDLRERGIGGRVGMVFTVGANGRVTSCRITRSSGIPELDALTCRLIQQRFRYRPSTDRYGRPIPDEVEGEHDWIARAG